MNRDIILGQLRHILSGMGVAWATKHGYDGDLTNTAIGGLVALLALVWSAYEKKHRNSHPAPGS